ncbi:hypothetical protein EOD42_22465 [Rhodovarius crocodyli]|uniref:Uncharacterized protein n=1 Tax=Rhodovarius crocodyli TaxID=1979269 RepID=A0A437M1E2_9PROT|nr:hypothetical protein [Rhodovarius crocodyli]RVT91422.1 hypothetical protein EOD42_22465 [Rhodovarius crocodyli]
MGTIRETAGGAWAEQLPGETARYAFSWDSVPSTSIWTCKPEGLAIVAERSGNETEALISGGEAGRWYGVTNTVELPGGQVRCRTFMLLFTAGLPTTGSALFPFPPDAVAGIRRDRLVKLAKSHLGGDELTDDVIWGKILAAEAEAERHLRVWLAPREVLPADPVYDADAAALAAAGERVEREPGYDYDPALFDGSRWGLLELRQRPISVVRWVRFAYPNPGSNLSEIPANWLRPEGTTNKVNIVPSTGTVSLPLNTFIMSILGGGNRVPFMLAVAYRAGIEDVNRRYPDLAQIVKRMALLSIVDDMLMPQSGSVSADGLSQSISFEADKHRDTIETKLDKLRDAIQGPRLVFV